MIRSDPDPSPPANPTALPPGNAGSRAVIAGRWNWGWMLTLAAGVVAGLAAWAGGEACLDRIKAPRHAVNSKGLVLNVTSRSEVATADAKNAGVAFALLGAALGAGLGMAGGLARRSVRAGASAAILGLIMGAASGAVMSLALLPLYNSYQARNPDEATRDLIFPLLVHAGVWSVVGALSGLAFALGLGNRLWVARIVVAGLAGAALGTVIYELIGAIAFPAAQTSRFVSTTWQTRLFARLAVTVFAAIGVALVASDSRKQPGPPEIGSDPVAP